MEKTTENDNMIFRLGVIAVPVMITMMIVGYYITN